MSDPVGGAFTARPLAARLPEFFRERVHDLSPLSELERLLAEFAHWLEIQEDSVAPAAYNLLAERLAGVDDAASASRLLTNASIRKMLGAEVVLPGFEAELLDNGRRHRIRIQRARRRSAVVVLARSAEAPASLAATFRKRLPLATRVQVIRRGSEESWKPPFSGGLYDGTLLWDSAARES